MSGLIIRSLSLVECRGKVLVIHESMPHAGYWPIGSDLSCGLLLKGSLLTHDRVRVPGVSEEALNANHLIRNCFMKFSLKLQE